MLSVPRNLCLVSTKQPTKISKVLTPNKGKLFSKIDRGVVKDEIRMTGG